MSKVLPLKNRLRKTLFGIIFAILSIFGSTATLNLITSTPVYAEPTPENSTTLTSDEPILIADAESGETTEETVSDGEPTSDVAAAEAEDTCYDQVGAIGWLICPSTGVLGKAIDAIYSQIEKLLVVSPVSTENTSPIYTIWQIMRDVTNIVFVIALLIIIYSQLTGLGIQNYGIKKLLPKIIVAAILINLSYLICAIAVDVSNIVGTSLEGIFNNIEVQAINAGGLDGASSITWTDLTNALIGGGSVAGLGVATVAGGLGGFLWPLIGVLIGGILSVIVGLITLGLRQALVAMLVMIAPLAFVAYLLPNTESWFRKWKDTFISMLIFFPLFSVLFGASKLAGWALIANALTSGSAFGIILGMAVQVFPLIASVSLMKMSSTVLGKISSKLDSLADKPRLAAKNLTGQYGELSRLRHINHAVAPSASIRRFMDRRSSLRTENIKNETTTRTARGQAYAMRSILGTKRYTPEDLEQTLKATKSTRGAKVAANAALDLQIATDDTAHVLDDYGGYYKNRQSKKLAEEAKHNFFEVTRSSLARVNDDEADIDFLTSEWLKMANKGHDSWEYRHFIRGAAGSLGEKGTESVLGQIITKAATNEARHRRDTAILMNKFKYNKTDARNMIVGYYVNDSGLATDKNGNDIGEEIPGYYLKNSPEKLVPYDKFDEKGRAYFDMIDQDGKYISRIYKDDGPAMKEILANFDMPINDPINGLYGILAGHYENETYTGRSGQQVQLPTVGLARYRTTIGRAILSSHFKEKASFASPMYAASVMNGDIKDYSHQFIARLDNLDKAGKAGNFNTQDSFEFDQLSRLMDPKNWPDLFPEDSLRSFRNVNSELMKAAVAKTDENGNVILDENGNIIYERIPRDNESEGSIDELRRTLVSKFFLPNSKKFTSMLSRYTQGTADNQKPGAAKNIKKLVENLRSWTDPETLEYLQKNFEGAPTSLGDPFAEQTDNFVYTSKEIREQILPRKPKSAYSKDDPASSSTIVDSHNDGDQDEKTNPTNPQKSNPTQQSNGQNYQNQQDDERRHRHDIGTKDTNDYDTYSLGNVLAYIDDIYNGTLDGDSRGFAENVMDYLDSAPELEGCAHDFSEVTFAMPYATVDELYNELIDIITARLSEY